MHCSRSTYEYTSARLTQAAANLWTDNGQMLICYVLQGES